jgi:hypothetical protein
VKRSDIISWAITRDILRPWCRLAASMFATVSLILAAQALYARDWVFTGMAWVAVVIAYALWYASTLFRRD